MNAKRALIACVALVACSADDSVSTPDADASTMPDVAAESAPPVEGGACGMRGLPPMSRVGTDLIAAGKPFRFLGYDIWSETWPSQTNLPNDGNVKYYPSSVEKVETDFARAHALGLRAIRVFLNQSMVPYDANSDTFDWTSFDAVIAAAQKYALYLVVSLSDGNAYGEPAWETSPDGGSVVIKTRQWYAKDDAGTAPFERANQYPKSFVSWATLAATHVAGDGTIGWFELQNEPHTEEANGGCIEASPSGQEGAAEALRRFADVAGGAIKAADPCRLVSLATIATSGDCGSKDGTNTQCHALDASCTSDWEYVNSSAMIDVVCLHDYSYHYATDAKQTTQFYTGWTDENHVRLVEAQQLGKPLYVGEVGMYAPPSSATNCQAKGRVETYPAACSDRVACFGLKLGAMFGTPASGEVSLSGALVWQATSGTSGLEGDCFSIGPTDPMDALLAAHVP